MQGEDEGGLEVPAEKPVDGALSREKTLSTLIISLFLVLGALLLAPRIFSFAEIAGSLVTWPWQFDYDEGINLNAALQLAEGRNIYRLNGPGEFISAPYPPLLYLILAPMSWLAGSELWPGRAVSLLATVAMAALIYWIVRRVTGLWGAGVFAGALWLAFSPVIVWSTLYKQDMPALALGLAGLAWALRYSARGTDASRHMGRTIYIAAPLFALAFYTKQSALAAAAATTLWLLVKDWRVGGRFLALLTLLIPGLFLVVDALLGGGLWAHAVGNHALSWSMGQIDRTWSRLWAEYWPLILWGGGALVGAALVLVRHVFGYEETRQTRFDRLLAGLSEPAALLYLYALVGGASNFVQMGYTGGNYNHALDGILPLVLVAGQSAGFLFKGALGLGRSSGQAKGVSPTYLSAPHLIGAAVVTAAFAAQLFIYAPARTWYRGGWPSDALHADMENLSNLVRSTHGDIFSEDATLLLRNGKRVLYDDPSTFVPLSELGEWDDSEFNRSLRERRFPIILLQRGSGRMTAEGREAFEASYRPKFSSLINTFEAVQTPPTPQFSLNCSLQNRSDNISLEGYALAPGVAQSGITRGMTLRMTLYWKPNVRPTRIYASYVHLVNEQGEKVAGQDNPQTGAELPPTMWPLDALTYDKLSIPIPEDAKPGLYRLIGGMYQSQDGKIAPLRVTCEQVELYDTSILLGSIEVR